MTSRYVLPDRADVYTRITAEIIAAVECRRRRVAHAVAPRWCRHGSPDQRRHHQAISRDKHRRLVGRRCHGRIRAGTVGNLSPVASRRRPGAQRREGDRSRPWKEIQRRRTWTMDPKMTIAVARGCWLEPSRCLTSHKWMDTSPSRPPSCPRPSASPMPRPSSPISASTRYSAAGRPTTDRRPIPSICRPSHNSRMRQRFTASGCTRMVTPAVPSTASTAT